ncbi:MAG: NAD(P)-dependent oxidoreductase [Lachnospiraceae bacterium]|nr:NAD(P)-dependent oxidoreductase [Lachnospiraceae bacterium]
MKKLLVTGASGFLGSRIVEYYKEKFEILAPSHSEMDITNEEEVACIFNKNKPNIVIHCAAISDVGRCEKEPERSWKINVDGCINIAKAAADISAKCIICSSDQVYFGSVVTGAHSEEEALRPFNLYGREKLTAEQKCLEVNADCVLLRLSWMYDTRTMNTAEHGDFMRTLLQNMELGKMLSYPIHDVRGITSAHEVVRNLEKAIELPGGVYNFGSPNDRSTYDTVYEVFTKLGLDVSRLQKNEDAFRDNPRNISMNQDKINKYGIRFSTTENGLMLALRIN